MLTDHLGIEGSWSERRSKIRLDLDFIMKCLDVNPDFSQALKFTWINSKNQMLSLFTDHNLINYKLDKSVVLGVVLLFRKSEHSTAKWYQELWKQSLKIIGTSNTMNEFISKIPEMLGREPSNTEIEALTECMQIAAITVYYKTWFGIDGLIKDVLEEVEDQDEST